MYTYQILGWIKYCLMRHDLEIKPLRMPIDLIIIMHYLSRTCRNDPNLGSSSYEEFLKL